MKSKGRRELINKIKDLRRELGLNEGARLIEKQAARQEIEKANARCDEFRRRLQVIGYNPEIEYIKEPDRGTLVSTIKVDAMRFDLTAAGMDADAIAQNVCGQLAKALYENGLVRIAFETLQPYSTLPVKVGRARVDVIPWDKICRNRGRIIMEDPDVPFAERRITMTVERGAEE
jgi:hypothetical protein